MQHSWQGGGNWGEVFLVAKYLRTRGPISGVSVTPQKLWKGKKPTVARLTSFGCEVFRSIDKKDRGGKVGAIRYEGNAEDSPSVRV